MNLGFIAIVKSGNLAEVKSFLKKGVDPNIQDEDGHTLLEIAIANNYFEIAEELEKHGGGFNARGRILRTLIGLGVATLGVIMADTVITPVALLGGLAMGAFFSKDLPAKLQAYFSFRKMKLQKLSPRKFAKTFPSKGSVSSSGGGGVGTGGYSKVKGVLDKHIVATKKSKMHANKKKKSLENKKNAKTTKKVIAKGNKMGQKLINEKSVSSSTSSSNSKRVSRGA